MASETCQRVLLARRPQGRVVPEDFRLEHSPGALFGLAELSVVPQSTRDALDGLASRGWKIAGSTHD